MGALVGFELTRRLRRCAMPQPTHLFVSGARAPQLPNPEAPIHHLADEEFINAIKRLEGTPERVIQNEELMNILLPCLRADIEIYETYSYEPEEQLSGPRTIFGGRQDKIIGAAELSAWREQSLGHCRIETFSGNHFFLQSSREQLLRVVADTLKIGVIQNLTTLS